MTNHFKTPRPSTFTFLDRPFYASTPGRPHWLEIPLSIVRDFDAIDRPVLLKSVRFRVTVHFRTVHFYSCGSFSLDLTLYFSPIYTLGTTYVDDSAPRKSAPVYVSIVYLIGAIGPAAGYILGGVVVTLWVDPLDEAKVTSNDSRWVGQWWLGFLIASLMLFITGKLTFDLIT